MMIQTFGPFPNQRTRPLPALFWVAFFLILPVVSGFSQSIDSAFSVWLLNNEARMMGILTTDREIMNRMGSPIGFLAFKDRFSPVVENELWQSHIFVYNRLHDLSQVLALVQKLGSGKVVREISKYSPGRWVTVPFMGIPVTAAKKAGLSLEKVYRETFFRCLGIEKGDDANLSLKVDKILGSIPDIDRRMLGSYLDNFIALYPGEKSGKMLFSLVKSGLKRSYSRDIAGSVNGALKGEGSSGSAESADQGVDDATLFESMGVGSSVASESEGTRESASNTAPVETQEPVGSAAEDPFKILN